MPKRTSRRWHGVEYAPADHHHASQGNAMHPDLNHYDMTYHDIVAELPPAKRREWYAYRREAMQYNELWSLLDRASSYLATSRPDLSAEMEAEMDRMMDDDTEDLFSDFMKLSMGGDE